MEPHYLKCIGRFYIAYYTWESAGRQDGLPTKRRKAEVKISDCAYGIEKGSVINSRCG